MFPKRLRAATTSKPLLTWPRFCPVWQLQRVWLSVSKILAWVRPLGRTRLIALLVCMSTAAYAWGQSTDSRQQKTPPPQERKGFSAKKKPDPQSTSLSPHNLLKNFAQDQKDIWSSPFKLRIRDLNWLVPSAGVTAGLIASDSE